MTAVDFAHFQVISAILSSLAFLPLGLIAVRLGGAGAARIAAVIVMLNPLFIQNCTYPWTKLPAAFFILAGLYFFLRVRSRDRGSRACAVLCGVLLGAGVVTHYSAGPYVLAIGVGWLIMGWRRDWADGLGLSTALAALGGVLVLAPWFGWSIAEFGLRGTFLSNTSVSMMQAADQSLPITMALNFRDSVIPPQVRGFQGTLFIQSSPWGWLRDQAFLVYQTNLVFAMGCVGSLAVLWGLKGASDAASERAGTFWVALIGSFIVLCLATYGDHDHYGNAHVCMQSIVLLGLAFLASRWGTLGKGWRIALAAGWAVDFLFGIALQFAVEDFAIDRWLTPGRNLAQVLATYGPVARESFSEKIIAHEAFFSDILTTQPAIVLALMGALLCMALVRARGAPAAQKSP
jgi:4-amino-4-deoxy-L-arabinose transferase-like glycosyltransferase